jgi:hypothetical protein
MALEDNCHTSIVDFTLYGLLLSVFPFQVHGVVKVCMDISY